MTVYLVQHGKSLDKVLDQSRGLSSEGVIKTEQMARLALEKGIYVSLIQHSVKERARQTAEIFGTYLKPENGIHEICGITPLDDVTVFAQNMLKQDDIMIVGHLPFLEKLTSYLITGNIDIPVIKFQNSGIVCLEVENENWFIKWTLLPEIE